MWAHQSKAQRETGYRGPARRDASARRDRARRGNRSMAGQGRATSDDTRIRYGRGRAEQVTRRAVHGSFLPESYGHAAVITEVSDEIENHFRRQRGEDWQRSTRQSEILRASLEIDGHVPDSRHWDSDEDVQYIIENQAHHIVEHRNAHGNGILRTAGIDPNSAANGVLLPVHDDDGIGDATLHNGSHVREYQTCINGALDNAVAGVQPGDEYREAVLDILQRTRGVLLTGNVPINRRVDASYNEENQGPETITQIFRQNGLF